MGQTAARRSSRRRARPPGRSRPAPPRRSRPARAGRTAPAGIRWDRVGRAAFLVVLAVVVLLYVAPLQQWVEQHRTASEHAAELQRLEGEHERLTRRAKELTSADAIEREARRLGMVKQGERAYVVEGLPRD